MPQTAADIAPLLSDLRNALQNLYGDRLHSVVLYGSYARGEATEQSDVDVMVVLHGTVNPMQEITRLVDITYPLELETGHLISVLPLAASDFKSQSKSLVQQAHEKGVPV
ncbi:MAG TPA: nucleotidyltransferase domain-containing protein [Rhodothermales bacterium]|nr:nucleotidyltransferase domain-containing protein [Rhodothermales bacterium]